jgi:hypothetical protein
MVFKNYVSFQLLNEPELGSGINSGMALTPFPSSIGRDLNPQPSDRELSMLTTRPDFSPFQVEASILIFLLGHITFSTIYDSHFYNVQHSSLECFVNNIAINY